MLFYFEIIFCVGNNLLVWFSNVISFILSNGIDNKLMLLNIISNFISIVVLKFILKLIIYILMILILGFGVIKGSMKFGLSFVLFIENDVV